MNFFLGNEKVYFRGIKGMLYIKYYDKIIVWEINRNGQIYAWDKSYVYNIKNITIYQI